MTQNTQLQKPDNAKPRTLADHMKNPAMVKMIGQALPKHITPDRMVRIVATALRTVPRLRECTESSFFGCMLQAAQLGLEPNTPLQHCWLIPRRNRKEGITECTFMLGYQGMIELAMRSGRITSIQAHAVFKGDRFEYEFGLDPKLIHVPKEDGDCDPKNITHTYAVARVKGSEPIFEVLTRTQIEARKARSETATKSFSPWKSDYEPMACKSAVRAIWAFIPKSAEMAAAALVEDAGPTVAGLSPGVVQQLQASGVQVLDKMDDDDDSLPVAFTEPDPDDDPLGDAAGKQQREPGDDDPEQGGAS